jgi:hypothetical protein
MNYKVLFISVFILIISIFNSFGQFSEASELSKFKKFLPDYVKFQFAGGIGFLSPGIGYTFFNNKLDISFFYSYLPEYITVDNLHSTSLQITGKFLKYKLTDNIELLPLNIGFFTHHTFGSEYWIRLPDNYPEGYYWWYPGINAGVFIGGEIKTKLLANKTPASGTAFYTRIGTRGLYLASKFGNSSIPLKDIVELGFGVAIYR